MAYGSVQLVPGVNVERTPTLLRTGFSQSQFIRFRDALVQKLGGWSKYYPFAVSGVPRALHAWEDLNQRGHLAIGTTAALDVITGGVLQEITPQTLVSDFVSNIVTTASSPTVLITDQNIQNVTVYDGVFWNTPVSIAGLILSGYFPIVTVTGATSYDITAGKNASASLPGGIATNAGTAAGNNVLHFASVPAWVVPGMVAGSLAFPSTTIPDNSIVTAVTGTTVTLSQNIVSPGINPGDTISFVCIPVFTTISGSAEVSVFFRGHGLVIDDTMVFQIPTTGNGVTVSGAYSVTRVTDADNFVITANSLADATGQFAMNGGKVELVYYINLGPTAGGAGYGLGTYGTGGYGTGVVPTAQTGTKLTAADWTLDNWGQIFLACPKNGGLYYWDPTGGFLNAALVPTAPLFNGGMFVSMSEQIVVLWGSTIDETASGQGIGQQQQPMLVQWCDVGDFFNWTASSATQAGNFVIPVGSSIKGGMATANQNLIWTDLDLWSMNYVGPPNVFGFNKIGAGAGLASAHAAQELRSGIYWMGVSNFYAYAGQGVQVIPCPVWDAVFQNLNTAYIDNVRALPNTPYNEVGWAYPSADSANGECDSYVKFNITEQNNPWDYGTLARSAWIDQSALGNPIGASPTGIIYQHETSPDADGQPLVASFTTGEFYLAEGEDYVFVDQILPDFKWGTFSGSPNAQIQLTFNVTNYPGDTPVSYGPYTVTQSTQQIATRFRGRLMSITVASDDIGSFWRIGSIKYRYSPAGRR